MSDSDRIKQAWQAGDGPVELPDIVSVRAGADLFYRQIRRRNVIEYVAAALVVVFFAEFALFTSSSVARIGAGLVVIAALFTTWQLHRRAGAICPEGDSALSLLEHQRRQLVRQRDAVSRVGRWYLLPFVPGMALMILAPAIEHGPGMPFAVKAGAFMSIAVVGLVFAGIWWLNRRAARTLQSAIDEVDALSEDRPQIR